MAMDSFSSRTSSTETAAEEASSAGSKSWQGEAEPLSPGVVAGLEGLASPSPLPAPALLDQKSDSAVSEKLEASPRIIGASTLC
jgi:hypothetical protein